MSPSADRRSEAIEVATLLGGSGLESAILCLDSLRRHSTVPFRFRIHEDGTLTPADVARLQQELPVSRVVLRRDADRVAREQLAHRPASRKLRSENVLALKLFDIVWFEESDCVRYVDSDVLFLRSFTGPPADAPLASAVFFPDRQSAYSMRFWELAPASAFGFPQRLNSGLFTLRKSAIDFELVERFLASWRGFAPMWIEQTCWALLAGTVDSKILDTAQFRIHDPGAPIDSELLALHFVSPVRSDLARIAALPQRGADPAVLARATATRPLSPWRAGFEALLRKAGR